MSVLALIVQLSLNCPARCQFSALTAAGPSLSGTHPEYRVVEIRDGELKSLPSGQENLKAFSESILFDAASALKAASDVSRDPVPAVTVGIPQPGFPSKKALYAAYAEGKSGSELLKALHDITGQGANINTYGTAKWYMFMTADNVEISGARGVMTAYSQVFVPGSGGDGRTYKEQGDMNGDGVVDWGVNAEHTWPQSFFNKKEPMKADIHHLQTTFITPNSRRGHLPFGTVQTRPVYSTRSGSRLGEGVFEPCDADKGNTARALFYFFVRYHDRNIRSGEFERVNFWNGMLDTILEWNATDPPDDNEKRRNDLVEQFQGNRNPFIDDPSLAGKIGTEALRQF